MEVLQRKVVKTGLMDRIVRILPRISLLLTVFSAVFMFSLAMDDQYRHTYISENALMPGQAQTFFRESEWNLVRGYRNEIVNLMHEPLAARNAFVEDLLGTIGYKTDILNYTDPKTGIEKPTLYGIYHVPKGDDTEAMVLTAPWYDGENRLNVNALALTIGLAQYFRRLSIWSKNIIIVFPEDSGAALRNWVDAYHTSLDNTGGSIESAILLDCSLSTDYIGFIEVEYAGVNGQLPNLDLINTVVQVAGNEGAKVSINGAPYGQLWTNDFYSRVTSLINGIFKIASAGIINTDGVQSFSGWNIQAVTLRGREGTKTDITAFGRVVESTFRSVNNLLEKFHQSFFFYLLLNSDAFVSVGMYLPATGMAAGSFLFASINAWVGGNNASVDTIAYIKNGLHLNSSSLVWASLTSISSIAMSMFYGIYCSNVQEIDYTSMTYKCFVIPLLALTLLPVFANIYKFKVHRDYPRSLATIVLFFMGYALIGLMVLNFSLSFIIAICASPLCFIAYSSKRDIKLRVKNTFLLIFSCPAVWLVVFGLVNKVNFDLDILRNLIQYFEMPLLQREIQHVLDFLEETDFQNFIDGPVELLVGLLSGYSRIQCWTWLYICLTWLPVWLCMIVVASVQVSEDADDIDQIKKNQ